MMSFCPEIVAGERDSDLYCVIFILEMCKTSTDSFTNISKPQNSSVEGVFPGNQRPTHPFHIIEHDAMSMQSMTSLGRVGRILAGSIDAVSIGVQSNVTAAAMSSLSPTQSTVVFPVTPTLVTTKTTTTTTMTTVHSAQALPNIQTTPSTSADADAVAAGIAIDAAAAAAVPTNLPKSNDADAAQANAAAAHQPIIFAEPDVIASTKLAHSKTTDSLKTVGPVAPMRRKKKTRKLSGTASEQLNPTDAAAQISDTMSLTLDVNRANLQPLTSALGALSIAESTTTASTAITTTSTTAATFAAAPATHPSPPKTPPPTQRSLAEQPQVLSSPATAAIASLTREIENSFTEAAAAAQAAAAAAAAAASTATASTSSTSSASLQHLAGGSMNRISHSLGNSSTSVCSSAKPSPSNSAKSNSAPNRVAQLAHQQSIDPNQGLNLYKATRGQYVVKPLDEATNKAEGPSLDEIQRVERIRAEILSGSAACSTATMPSSKAGGAERARFAAGTSGSNSLGSGMRFSTSAARLAASAAAAAARERRKSAGDEDVLRQLNIAVRTRTDSGKQLSDLQILEQVRDTFFPVAKPNILALRFRNCITTR